MLDELVVERLERVEDGLPIELRVADGIVTATGATLGAIAAWLLDEWRREQSGQDARATRPQVPRQPALPSRASQPLL